MTQKKIDDLFSQRLSNKRSRTNQTTIKRDEFDDLFENNSSIKRRRTNNNNQSNDVFDFTIPSTLKKKRSMIIDDDDDDDNETKAIDDIFNNDQRKKLRRTQIKKEDSIDLLDMFKTTTTSFDDFKISKTQTKKIKMFFDDSDLISIRDEQNTTKDYTQIKPVLITSGQWLSKQAETKSTIESSEIPDDERNLMHIQYAPLIIDDDNDVVIHNNKKSKKISKTIHDGKSFQKQLVHSDPSILRKENFQSCYNALLEDLNKPQITLSLNRSTDKKLKQSLNNIDDEQLDQIDFFDLSTRRKKF